MPASEVARSVESSSALREQGSTCLEAYIHTLKTAPETSVETFLQHHPEHDRSQLVGLVAIEMRHRWQRGGAEPVEAYLTRFPELQKDDEQLLDLIYAEYCARRGRGDHVDGTEYYRRFPAQEQQLQRLFCVHSFLTPALDEWTGDTPHNLPEVGDEFLDFRLLRELGRGAFARVFLAQQGSLSDRLVAVKITGRRTIEPQTLARMQHCNIVPVYSVHSEQMSGLLAVCMPYQGGVALSDLQATWLGTAALPQRADVLLRAVRERGTPEAANLEVAADAPRFPRRASYVHACAWIMHRLADALVHAHERGICHRDLKPSNILITPDGQPLLVDFNLAFNPSESRGDPTAFFGGTLPYMPPEQLAAFHSGQPGAADEVGPQSDLYSLAATFYELLTGRPPFGTAPRDGERLAILQEQIERRYAALPPAREPNPEVPSDLNALLLKCLDPQPGRRYESAAQLSEDLQRFLEDRPLQHIGKIGRGQIALKFVRRNRRHLASAAVLLVLGFSVAVLGRVAHVHGVHAKQELQNRVHAEAAREQIKESLKQTEQRYGQELQSRVRAEYERAQAEGKLETYEPETADDFMGRGYLYMSKQLYAEAEADFTRALDLAYRYKDVAYHFRGRCRAAQDTLEKDREAIEDYSAAIKANPRYVFAYVGRGLTYTTSKFDEIINCEQGIRDAEAALRLLPDQRAESLGVDVARIYSAAVWHNPDLKDTRPELLNEAERLIVRAAEKGYSLEIIRTPESCGPLRERPAVARLLASKPR